MRDFLYEIKLNHLLTVMNKDYLKILPREIIKVVTLFAARLFTMLNKSDSPLWLISERGTDARDNAYFFFVWLKENHPEINAKYVISDKSKDYPKLLKYKASIVIYDSFDHYKKIWRASYLISTHICGYRPDLQYFSELDRRFNILKSKKKVFLQHGIIKNDLKALYAKNVNLDLFICGAKPEYDYVKSKFGFKSGIVEYTGLCRYDNLLDFSVKKQILIMPTWRMYIDKHHFKESLYFDAYRKLLTSKAFQDIAIRSEYKIIFYPHYEIQQFIDDFKNLPLSSNIIIADMSYDVQTLLKESAVLITDYSSVFFDFAFMHKPILFYQFDKKEFFSKHYHIGYISEGNFGKVVETIDGCCDELKYVFSHNCEIDEIYRNYIDAFFEKRDNNNCLRVFNAIKAIKK